MVFIKVLGHAEAMHVRSGSVTREDKDGNDAADALAVAAAAHHAPACELVARAVLRQETAATHRMMIRIVNLRFDSEHMDDDSDADAVLHTCSARSVLGGYGNQSMADNEESANACACRLPVEIEPS